MAEYRVRVLGGYEKLVRAETEYMAKTEALRLLRLGGHSLRPLNRDRSESYALEAEMDGVTVRRRAEVHALKLGID